MTGADSIQHAKSADPAALRTRLAGQPPEGRLAVLLDLVRTSVTDALGYATADEIDADQLFMDLGFDSLTAIELRNALNSATGLNVSAVTVLDHPTPQALAEYLSAAMHDQHDQPDSPADGRADRDLSDDERDPVPATSAGR